MSFLDTLEEAGEKVEGFVKKEEKLHNDYVCDLEFTKKEDIEPIDDRPKRSLKVYQNDKNQVYFKEDLNKFYYVTAYKWVGAEYRTYEVGGSNGAAVSTSHGGLGSALIGTALGGPAGGLIGYALGHHTDTEIAPGTPPHEVTEEVNTPATITFTPIDGGPSVSIEFECNTDLDKKIQSLDLSHIPTPQEAAQAAENDKFNQMEEYKKLLDDHVITQEEFDEKKKELLGL